MKYTFLLHVESASGAVSGLSTAEISITVVVGGGGSLAIIFLYYKTRPRKKVAGNESGPDHGNESDSDHGNESGPDQPYLPYARPMRETEEGVRIIYVVAKESDSKRPYTNLDSNKVIIEEVEEKSSSEF